MRLDGLWLVVGGVSVGRDGQRAGGNHSLSAGSTPFSVVAAFSRGVGLAASSQGLRRQQAQRSSTFHSTAGNFRFVSFRTGTTRVFTSPQVGFQRWCIQQPQSSFLQTLPHHTLGPGMQKSSHRASQQTFVISFSIIFGTPTFRTPAQLPHWSQRPSGGGGSFFLASA